MRGLVCVSICLLQITSILAAQFPISWKENQLSKEPLDIESPQWNLGITPNNDSTGRLVFDTVGALAQRWPNTRYRHGHNIVPATVPTGTLLYHGTNVHVIPTGPEWTSVDPEHSYLFCRTVTIGGGCWQLTLVTTRTLNLLYFDGSSAAKLEDGSLDSQEVLAWGSLGPDRNHRETERVKLLCDWGTPIGYDGFVRMEMDFEVVLCDFTQGVEMVSFLNLVPKSQPSDPRPPIPDSGMSPPEHVHPLTWLSVLEAGSWNNRYPGDMRIKLDLTRLVSFYDTALFPSLIPLRKGQTRWSHRLKGISNTDAESLKQRLRIPKVNGSGIDWLSLIRVIKNRYEERLEVARYILNPITAETADVTMQRFTTHLQRLITPYNIFTATPPEDTTFNHSWVVPIYENCASTHTAYISGPAFFPKLTQSEKLILGSIQEVNGEICRVIVRIWGERVEHAQHTNRANTTTSELVSKWKESVEGLMTWLDWSEWVKCTPGCGFEEMCYLPTWPFFLFDKDEDWFKPQPKCIRRIAPLTFNLK